MVVFEAVFIVGYYKMQTLSHQTLRYRPQRWGKNRGSSTFGQSNDLQVFRSQGWGRYTQMGNYRQGSVPQSYRILHSCDGHTQPSQCITKTPLEATSTLLALHLFTPSSIHTNNKEKDVFPPFVLNEKNNEPRVETPILLRSRS